MGCACVVCEYCAGTGYRDNFECGECIDGVSEMCSECEHAAIEGEQVRSDEQYA